MTDKQKSGQRPRVEVPQPSQKEVEKYRRHWGTLERYLFQEKALEKLFLKTYPHNGDINDVLIKVAVLNDFYSTNIFFPFQVANHIFRLEIDDRLQGEDMTVVNDIAKVTMDNGSVKNFYSFATKYCGHHKPLDFPIYDSYIDGMLRYFRDAHGFSAFRNLDLKNYGEFKKVLVQFREFYSLGGYTLQEIDRYLWLLGKEKFPKNY